MAVVEDVEPRIQYVATNGQTEFDFPFLVYSDASGDGSYLKVLHTDGDGVTATLVEGTDYTVAGLDTTGGGTITLTSGATAGDRYTLYRDLPIQTFFTFATAGDYFATDVNKQNNLILQMIQQLDMRMNRSLYAPLEAVIDSLSLPSPEAGKVLQWNDAGTAIVNAEPDGTVDESANAWDLESASYDGISFSVASESAFPASLWLKPDGSKMYILDPGGATAKIYQYTLGVPGVVSSAVYDSVSKTLNSGVATGFYFRADGVKLYAIYDGSSDSIEQYTLTTPWDISTASYDSETKSISALSTVQGGLFFSPDGRKVFHVSDNPSTRIYQQTLSTPWSIATASDSSVYLDISGESATPLGIFMKPDGTKLYLVDDTADAIFQYNLPTAWSLSGASYDDVFFSLNSQETQPKAVFFKADGSRFYACGSLNDKVYQYSIT